VLWENAVMKGFETQNTVSEDTDVMIIDRVLGGDRDAYAEIVRRYQSRVRGQCLVMFADSTQADDAAQEVFIKVYRSLGQFRGDSAFSTWLYRIAVNYCHDLLRKTARHRTESWEALLEKEGSNVESLLFSPPSDSAAAGRVELAARILSVLSEKARTILLLRERDGLSYQELAGVLNCSPDAVKARLKRARQELDKKKRHFLEPGTSNKTEA
jgi:RNA polymerase sigma-70 factor (ECF subfamily)